MKQYRFLKLWLCNGNHLTGLFLIVFFFSNLHQAYSQVYFNQLYNEGSSFKSILETNNGYFSSFQLSNNYPFGKKSTWFDSAGKIMHMDTAINQVFRIEPIGMAKVTSTNNSIITLVSYKSFPNNNRLGIIIEDQEKKTILPEIKFQDTVSVLPNNFIYHDGKIIITGDARIWNAIEQNHKTHLILMHLDTLGNKIWEHSYPPKSGFNLLQGVNLIATKEGGYAVGGVGGTSMSVSNSESFLLITDSFGNRIRERYFESVDYGNTVLTIHQKADSNFIVVYGKRYEIGSSIFGPSSLFTTIEELDYSSLQTIWSKDYLQGHLNQRAPLVLIPQNDSVLLISGIYKPDGNDWFTGDYAFQLGFIFAITENGDSLWYRDYGSFTEPFEYNYLNHIAVTSDGGIVGAGRTETRRSPFNGAPGMHAWLFKADSIGCLYPGCDTVYHTAPNLPIAFRVYPNPVNPGQSLTITAPDLSQATATLYNAMGQAVATAQLVFEAGTSTLATPQLSSGLYLLHLQTNTGVRYVEKITVY
jgi:hypothetical protein